MGGGGGGLNVNMGGVLGLGVGGTPTWVGRVGSGWTSTWVGGVGEDVNMGGWGWTSTWMGEVGVGCLWSKE